MSEIQRERQALATQFQVLMATSDDDLDLAFNLQLEEAMAASLLQPQQQQEDDDPQILELLRNLESDDPQSVELALKLEQEENDAEEWEREMRRKIGDDLKIQTHDHMFAQEILRIPDDEWVVFGDNVHKPLGEATSSDDREPFRLYFKGLFSDEEVGEGLEMVSVAAIGVAVCDFSDNLILEVQKPLGDDWMSDCAPEDLQLKVEVKALIEGLNLALSLDIKKIEFFCDFYPLFHYITTNWLIKQQRIGKIVDQVCLLQRQFDSCCPVFVARKDVKFAFKLAREAIDTQITRSVESIHANLKETCTICLEDTVVSNMFVVDGCLHRYCLSCMKQHAEVKLLHGREPTCPYESCATQLDIPICRKFLSSEMIDLMNQRMKESSIPVTEKVYCPYPRCSALMSKFEVSPFPNDVFIEWCAIQCTKCEGIFCIQCQVPWHSNMSCSEYKRLNPNPSAEDAKLKSLATTSSWRECVKCKNMIELASGCYHITCRCSYEFCYTCGAEWRNKKATCTCPIWDERNIVNGPLPA